MDPVIKLLGDLVAIPSVNPMGRALRPELHLESRITTYLEEWFQSLGIAFERQLIEEGRVNLIAKFESPGAQCTILFDAHQDTVPIDGMIVDPFGAAIENGRMYGRGACDIKGGMAAMLTAFARLVRERPRNAANVVMACTVDEEFTHKGSSRLAVTDHGADLAIVSEPTRLQIVNCHKGAVRWKIRSKGVACHSSTPDLGENAIYRMAPVVLALADHAAELSRDRPHNVLGVPTLSVGRIEGGQSVNIVPDWAEIEIDRRLIPGESADDCIGRVRSFLEAKLGSLSGLEFQAPWVKMPSLSPERSNSSFWLEPIGIAIQGVTGMRPQVNGVPYGTDAGPLGEKGLSCLVIGPGDIAQAHTKDEWVELDQIRLASEVYYSIAAGLGSISPEIPKVK